MERLWECLARRIVCERVRMYRGLEGEEGCRISREKQGDLLPPSSSSRECWTLRRARCSTRQQQRRQPRRTIPQTDEAPNTTTPALRALPVEPQAGRAKAPRLHLPASPLVQRHTWDLSHWQATTDTVLKGVRSVPLAAAELSVGCNASTMTPRRRGCRGTPYGRRQVDRHEGVNDGLRRARNEGIRGRTRGGLGGEGWTLRAGGSSITDCGPGDATRPATWRHGKQNRITAEERTQPRICTVTQKRTAERGEIKQGPRTKTRDTEKKNPPKTPGMERSRKSRQHDLPHRL